MADSQPHQPKRSRTANGPNHRHEGDVPQILIASRDDEFTAASWWMVDIENEDVTQGATPLVKRCMRVYNWNATRARKVLKAYRQFLFLKKHYEDWDAKLLSPSSLVDQMWHQHILDVVNYCHDMMLICGHVVGHNPDGAEDLGARKIRLERTHDAFKEHFDGKFDAEIWGFPSSSIDLKISIGPSDHEEYLPSYPVKRSEALWSHLEQYVHMRKVDMEAVEFRFNDVLIDSQSSPRSLRVGRDSTAMTVQIRATKVSVEIHRDLSDFVGRYMVDVASPLSPTFMQFAHSLGHGEDDFEFTYFGAAISPTLSARSLQNLDFSPESFHPLRLLALLPSETSAEKRAAGNDTLKIRLKDQSGEETFFVVKRHTRMGKLMRSYAVRKGVSVLSLRFLLSGDIVDSHTTPRRLELEDDDQIDVVLEQTGC
jgi:small ubiquitin-related modifier